MLCLALLQVCLIPTGFAATAVHSNPKLLNPNARELLAESLDWGNRFWDQDAKLLRYPGHSPRRFPSSTHVVRDTSWYALGLLFRDGPGDRRRAADILDAVLKQQFTHPGVRWYGTFRRAPEEPDPAADAVMWRNYDPNWREFIGTTFAIILTEYPERISEQLAKKMYAAIDLAVEGEIAEGRLLPSYTNIALMYGFLLDFAAEHSHRADWQKRASTWTESVYDLFKQYDSFNEYNSPTYYGVDLYGLDLWRAYGSTEQMRSRGREMEATIWRDIAAFYHPVLRNMSGPYDRAYGMDMESYVSLVGVWMRSALDAEQAPLPKIEASTDHLSDLWFAPHLVILGTHIPQDALEQLQKFHGEHLVRKQITAQRVATAWIGRTVMYGGEATEKTKDAGPSSQFHPATIQWRTPSGEIGWVRLVESPPVDAVADKQGISISAVGTLRFRLHVRQMDPAKINAKEWILPGMKITVRSDAKQFRAEVSGEEMDLVYTQGSEMRLDVEASAAEEGR